MRSAVALGVVAQIILLTAFSLLLISPAHSQDLFAVTPATKDFQILIDSNVEEHPRYNGGGTILRPARGATTEFRIFMPEAAGMKAYSFQIAFQERG